MASTSQVRRLANVLGLAIHAGTDGERASACNTMSNMLQRLGYDSSSEEDLLRLVELGLNGKAPKVSDDPNSRENRNKIRTAVNIKDFSRSELSHHEGVSHPKLIRVLALNARSNKSLSQLEVAMINDMSKRTPRKIHPDEWDQVTEIVRKIGLSNYMPEYADLI